MSDTAHWSLCTAVLTMDRSALWSLCTTVLTMARSEVRYSPLVSLYHSSDYGQVRGQVQPIGLFVPQFWLWTGQRSDTAHWSLCTTVLTMDRSEVRYSSLVSLYRSSDYGQVSSLVSLYHSSDYGQVRGQVQPIGLFVPQFWLWTGQRSDTAHWSLCTTVLKWCLIMIL